MYLKILSKWSIIVVYKSTKGVYFMNNKQIEYAIALSKSLNFSAVAESFGISQPALSKQILNLEKELGTELFDRTTNPIKLTAAGEYFLREAQELLYKEEQLYKSMDDFKSGKKGCLTIGISPFRALYLLPELCKKVREKFPDIVIKLQEDSSDIIRTKACEGKYDFAIINLPVNDAILDVTPIEQDILVLVVPKAMLNLIDNLPANELSELNLRACKKLPFVVVGQNQEMRMLFDKICLASDIKPEIAMEVVGLATAWSMSTSGIGATLLPLQFVKNMESNSNISLFLPKHNTDARQPAIITKRGQYLSEYAKYAIEVLTKQ